MIKYLMLFAIVCITIFSIDSHGSVGDADVFVVADQNLKSNEMKAELNKILANILINFSSKASNDLKIDSKYDTLISATRLDHHTNSIHGVFHDFIYPTTTSKIIKKKNSLSNQFIKKNIALDSLYEFETNGKRTLTEIEYTLDLLKHEIFLYVLADNDIVLETGGFGAFIKITNLEGKYKNVVLPEAKQVSIISPSGLKNRFGKRIGYNPNDFSLEEIHFIINRLLKQYVIDLVVVDKTIYGKPIVRIIKMHNKIIALLSADLWKLIGEKAVFNTSDISMIDISEVKLTKEISEIITANTMVKIPKGTFVIVKENKSLINNEMGFLIKKPKRIPLAKYTANFVTWLMFDNHHLNDDLLYLADVIEDDYFKVSFEDKSGNVYYERLIGKGNTSKIAPIVMLNNDLDPDIIGIQIGVNWENPFIEMNKKGAFAMTFDNNTNTFIYHIYTFPPTESYKITISKFDDKPKLKETYTKNYSNEIKKSKLLTKLVPNNPIKDKIGNKYINSIDTDPEGRTVILGEKGLIFKIESLNSAAGKATFFDEKLPMLINVDQFSVARPVKSLPLEELAEANIDRRRTGYYFRYKYNYKEYSKKLEEKDLIILPKEAEYFDVLGDSFNSKYPIIITPSIIMAETRINYLKGLGYIHDRGNGIFPITNELINIIKNANLNNSINRVIRKVPTGKYTWSGDSVFRLEIVNLKYLTKTGEEKFIKNAPLMLGKKSIKVMKNIFTGYIDSNL